jgi:hypothetical protein
LPVTAHVSFCDSGCGVAASSGTASALDLFELAGGKREALGGLLDAATGAELAEQLTGHRLTACFGFFEVRKTGAERLADSMIVPFGQSSSSLCEQLSHVVAPTFSRHGFQGSPAR